MIFFTVLVSVAVLISVVVSVSVAVSALVVVSLLELPCKIIKLDIYYAKIFRT